MQSLVEQGYRTFVEVGPHPVLIGMGTQCVEDAGITWVGTLRRRPGRVGRVIVSAFGALYVQGAKIDWQAIRPRVSAPPSCPAHLSLPARTLLDDQKSRKSRGSAPPPDVWNVSGGTRIAAG